MVAATLTKDNEVRMIGMLKDICGPIIAETIEAHMAPMREQYDKFLAGKNIITSEVPQDGVASALAHVNALVRQAGGAVSAPPHQLAKVDQVTRMIRAIAAGKGIVSAATDWYYKNYGDDPICKALAATDATAGGFLVPEEMATSVIELLRPMSAIRQLNPITMSMTSGTFLLPKLTAGSAAGYIGENQNAPATQPVFGQVQMVAKKLAAIVPVSNDMIRRTAGDTNTMIRDDLVAAIAQRSDLAFIRGDGTAGSPKGLKFWTPSANAIACNASPVTENVINDLGRLITLLMQSNVRMIRPSWVMAPRTQIALMTALDANSNYVFRQEMLGGTLWGWPFATTTQIPIDLTVTGSAESELYLADFADVVIGETTSLMLSASDTAAYHDGSGVVSAFSLDQNVVRAIVEHDMVVRHAESIAYLKDVDWVTVTT